MQPYEADQRFLFFIDAPIAAPIAMPTATPTAMLSIATPIAAPTPAPIPIPAPTVFTLIGSFGSVVVIVAEFAWAAGYGLGH